MNASRAPLSLALLVAALVTAWCLRPLWDIDLWWHIATGRLILEQGIPDRDVFSAVDPTAPWRTFQWGYEVLVAWVDAHLGLRALQVLHAGTIGLAAGLAAGFGARRAGVAPAVAAVALGLLLFEDRVRARPHVFELLFVVALLPWVTERVKGSLWELGAVLMAGVWANLHAVSALWWPALVGAWALGRPSPRRLGVLVGGVVVMLASPPAREGLIGAFRSHRAWPAELVPELRNTLAYTEEGWWGAVMLLGVAAGALAALHRLREDVGWPERLVALGCGLAACLMGRWVWFAAIPLGLWLMGRRGRWTWGLSALCALALVGRLAPRWQHGGDYSRVVQEGAFPEAAMDWMLSSGLTPRLDVQESWTGYALYRAHPPLTTLGDGRLIFRDDVAELFLRRADGDLSTFDEAVVRYDTRALLWSTAHAPPLNPGGWKLVYQDEVASLWVPKF